MTLLEQIKGFGREKVPVWQALCSCLRETRHSRLLEKAESTHKKKLDVRSFMRSHTDLSILLKLVLTKEQMLLFQF